MIRVLSRSHRLGAAAIAVAAFVSWHGLISAQTQTACPPAAGGSQTCNAPQSGCIPPGSPQGGGLPPQGGFSGGFPGSPQGGGLPPQGGFPGGFPGSPQGGGLPPQNSSGSFPGPTSAGGAQNCSPSSPPATVVPQVSVAGQAGSGGSYCTLSSGGQVWLPAGDSPSSMGC
jgi:hypothetical protein